MLLFRAYADFPYDFAYFAHFRLHGCGQLLRRAAYGIEAGGEESLPDIGSGYNAGDLLMQAAHDI